MPPYADPEVRRRVNRQALQRKRAAARRQAAEPRPSPAPQWSPPAPPAAPARNGTGVRGTPEARRLRDAPPAPGGGHYYQILATEVRPIPAGLIAAIFVAAGLLVAGVWYLASRESAAEVGGLIDWMVNPS